VAPLSNFAPLSPLFRCAPARRVLVFADRLAFDGLSPLVRNNAPFATARTSQALRFRLAIDYT